MVFVGTLALSMVSISLTLLYLSFNLNVCIQCKEAGNIQFVDDLAKDAFVSVNKTLIFSIKIKTSLYE